MNDEELYQVYSSYGYSGRILFLCSSHIHIVNELVKFHMKTHNLLCRKIHNHQPNICLHGKKRCNYFHNLSTFSLKNLRDLFFSKDGFDQLVLFLNEHFHFFFYPKEFSAPPLYALTNQYGHFVIDSASAIENISISIDGNFVQALPVSSSYSKASLHQPRHKPRPQVL